MVTYFHLTPTSLKGSKLKLFALIFLICLF